MTDAPVHRFDHLVVIAETLADGLDHVRKTLGIDLPEGGKHPVMGTHNHVGKLSETTFLEVIAIDPDAPPPGRPRWFGLDAFSGPPRLAHWLVNSTDLDASLAAAPNIAWQPMLLTRDTLRWRFAVTEDGSMPFNGVYPTFLQWDVTPHPASRMGETHCKLQMLDLAHPRADEINNHLAAVELDISVECRHANQPEIRAEFMTPDGPRSL